MLVYISDTRKTRLIYYTTRGIGNVFYRLTAGKKNNPLQNKRLKNGGADRDRTDDLRLAKPALSQLSYSPTLFWRGFFGGVILLEGEQDRRGDKEREEGETENIGAE